MKIFFLFVSALVEMKDILLSKIFLPCHLYSQEEDNEDHEYKEDKEDNNHIPLEAPPQFPQRVYFGVLLIPITGIV